MAESIFFLATCHSSEKTGGWQFLFSTNLCLPLSNVSCNKFINVFFSIMASCQLIKMAMANSNKRLSLDGDFLMANQIAISDHGEEGLQAVFAPKRPNWAQRRRSKGGSDLKVVVRVCHSVVARFATVFLVYL